MANPAAPKKVDPASPTQRWGFLLLAVSLLLNATFIFYKKNKADEVLVSVDGRSFRWRDISTAGQKTMMQLDASYYAALKAEAERWAGDQVLLKEAAALNTTPQELIKSQVNDKVQVGEAEVAARYALSPRADKEPWPAVLKQIESELRTQRTLEMRQAFFEPLFRKHAVDFKLKAPLSYSGDKPAPTRFPVYAPPPVDLNTPSRGSANAPVVIEAYSDFMCPYSKAFSATLTELEKQYPEKLRVVFRHFPLPIHPDAPLLHQASVCAQEQGKFWELHDRLMAEKSKLDKDALLKLGAQLGLDAGKLGACIGSPAARARVDQDVSSGKAAGVSGTPGFLINGRLSSGALPPQTVKSYIDWHLKPSGRYPGAADPAAQKQAARQQPSGPPREVDVPADWLKKGPSKGPADAPITIVEAMDYHCPFCKKGAATMEELFQKNPAKIRLAPKNYPLPMHKNAFKAAEAALCADEQGKYWDLRKEILGDSWGKQLPEDLKAAAKKSGLDEKRFSACLDSSKMKAAVEEDMKIAASLGVRGTPAYFVEGAFVSGAQPLENFQKVVDAKLAAKKEKTAK